MEEHRRRRCVGEEHARFEVSMVLRLRHTYHHIKNRLKNMNIYIFTIDQIQCKWVDSKKCKFNA